MPRRRTSAIANIQHAVRCYPGRVLAYAVMKQLLLLTFGAFASEAMAQDAQCVPERAAMVETIRAYARLEADVLGPQGISESVLEAMGKTQRHLLQSGAFLTLSDLEHVSEAGQRWRWEDRFRMPLTKCNQLFGSFQHDSPVAEKLVKDAIDVEAVRYCIGVSKLSRAGDRLSAERQCLIRVTENQKRPGRKAAASDAGINRH